MDSHSTQLYIHYCYSTDIPPHLHYTNKAHKVHLHKYKWIQRLYKWLREGLHSWRDLCSLHNMIQTIRQSVKHSRLSREIIPQTFFMRFLDAIFDNQIHFVRQLILKGENLNMLYPSSDSEFDEIWPLHYACHRNNFEIVKLLVENGADIDLHDDCHPAPLFYAIQNGNKRVAEYLLDRGARCNIIDLEDTHLLYFALLTQERGIFKLLLEHDANPSCVVGNRGNTILHEAVTTDPKCAKMLLDHGSDINAQNMYGRTPLNEATDEGDLNVIKMLIERGASVTIPDYYGDTPMMNALSVRRTDVYKLLWKCEVWMLLLGMMPTELLRMLYEYV